MHTFLYDTTLRDGTQGEGINLSTEDKLKIARRLDDFGMHYIEGGWPGSNPKDQEFFARAKYMHFAHAKLTAFGSTRKAHMQVAQDPQIKALLQAFTPVVTLVGKTSTLHVTHVLETSPEENLSMIGDSAQYFKHQNREVIHDAEHYFDGFKLDKAYALATLRAAQQGGADWLALCDTNGGSLPWEIEEIVRETRAALSDSDGYCPVRFGIHTHNDAGLAVANALAAVRAGCEQVQATINGIGERVGNCDMVATLANLKLKLGDRCVSSQQLRRLTELSRFIDETANVVPNIRQPYVGQAAFAHKGGIHVAAVLKLAESYQHIDPTQVGNQQRVLVSELSGRGNIAYKAKEFGLNPDSDEVKGVLAQIKDLENRGFYFEGADASLELMLRRHQPGYTQPFEQAEFMVMIQHRIGGSALAEAAVKLKRSGEAVHTAGDGAGPIEALDRALRRALEPQFPQLRQVRLMDYKVRIIDSDKATSAMTRVLIVSSDDAHTWTTVGAAENVVEASWVALIDAFEYALTCRQSGAISSKKALAEKVLAEGDALHFFLPLARENVVTA